MVAEVNTTSTHIIQITTAAQPTICVPSNLFAFNEPFYLNSPGGESLATWSTVILFFYILLSVLLYNWRSWSRTRDEIQIFITSRQKVASVCYWIVLAMFEIICVYGAAMREDSTRLNAPMTFFNVLIWCMINTYSVVFLLFAFCSKEKFRLYMWTAVVIQLPYYGYLIVERMVRRAVEADLLITGMLFLLCAFHAIDAPKVFQISNKMSKFYVQEVAEFSTSRNIIVSNSNLYDPLGNDTRDTTA
jgi:hypothetical protein